MFICCFLFKYFIIVFRLDLSIFKAFLSTGEIGSVLGLGGVKILFISLIFFGGEKGEWVFNWLGEEEVFWMIVILSVSPIISIESFDVVEEFEWDWVIGGGSSASEELGGEGEDLLFKIGEEVVWGVCISLGIAPVEIEEEGIVEVVGVIDCLWFRKLFFEDFVILGMEFALMLGESE